MSRQTDAYPGSTPVRSLLTLAISSTLLLGACASGGGSHAGSSVSPPPSAPPPPAPPPPATEPPPPPPASVRSLVLPAAPAPATAPVAPALVASTSLVFDVPAGSTAFIPDGSRSGSLQKTGAGEVYQTHALRFDGGTTVSAGRLQLYYANLFSDVTVDPGATLAVSGDIVGDVINNGTFEPTDYSAALGEYMFFYDDIFGDYTQGPEGVLRVLFGIEGQLEATPLLTVHGRAHLDGHLEFARGGYIPSDGYLEWVLHASEGVSGQFDDWRISGPSLFLEGTLHTGPNDVWFTATRVSTQAALAASGAGDSFTLASAARVDRAFDLADALARRPAGELDARQRAFLDSAAGLQRIGTPDRAVAAFDSLAGHGHVAALDAVLGDALDAGPAASLHAANLAEAAVGASEGSGIAQWSAAGRFRPSADGLYMDLQGANSDQRLDARRLIGTSLGWSEAVLSFGRDGGHARDSSPRWQAWLRREGDDGNYSFASVGASQHQLVVDRRVDVGAGAGFAQSTRDATAANAYFEAGRAFDTGGHRVTAFAALDYAVLHAGALAEVGSTGLEFNAPASWRQQLRMDTGLRDVRRWNLGGDHWLELGGGVVWRQQLVAPGALTAAFSGMPGANFELASPTPPRNGPAARLDLLGGGSRWAWRVQLHAAAGQDAASASIVRWFR